ncbi:ATP-binding protein [Kitasatospora sp. NPDC048298]|uniref:ATP-binding protein n=1 Tax=Kitasatospora sp. NPDC048298 TaxID=3364049 RepID=UPI00371219EC
MGAPKSVVLDGHYLVLADGGERDGPDHDHFLLHVDDLPGLRPADLKAALKQAVKGADVTVSITRDEYANFDWKYSSTEPVYLGLSNGELIVTIDYESDKYELDQEDEIYETFSSILKPYLERNRASLTGVKWDSRYAYPSMWHLKILCSLRNRDASEILRVGEGALTLIRAFESGRLTRETTLDLLRSGNANVLIDQEEGPWLDVKADHYNLQSQPGKISIAQAVSRFANAEHGGIVVVGMRGKRIPGGEVISGICPVPVDGRTLRRYQDAIEKHLYPPPDLLDIELVPTDGGSLVVLHIPPQPEELKPFLVHGAIVDGRVEGAFISIVRRRGESSIPITAPAIHATLAAGRALLRRGELPRE